MIQKSIVNKSFPSIMTGTPGVCLCRFVSVHVRENKTGSVNGHSLCVNQYRSHSRVQIKFDITDLKLM